MRPKANNYPNERSIYNKCRDCGPCVVFFDAGKARVAPLRTATGQRVLSGPADVIVGVYDHRVRAGDLREDLWATHGGAA